MSQIKKAQSILSKVYDSFQGDVSVSGKNSGYYFVVIPGNKEPRWIVPISYRLGGNVLSQWQPYGFSSQLKWHIICFLYRLGGITQIPGIQKFYFDIKTDLNIPGQKKNIIPVIYVGTPGPQQKAVVTLIDTEQGNSIAVLKVALEKGAHDSLLREAEILQLLSDFGVKNVPLLLSCDTTKGRTWQSVITGQLTSRNLTKLHINWLLNLPRTGKSTTFDDQKNKLNKALDNECEFLFEHQVKIIKFAIKKINGKSKIPLVLVHGDFAPWNLKQYSNSELAVIDWEDTIVDGLPLWDLCHFYYIQGHLFHEEKRVINLLNNHLVSKYCLDMELKSVEQFTLILLYLLFMITNKNKNVSNEYRNYLINQISVLSSI